MGQNIFRRNTKIFKLKHYRLIKSFKIIYLYLILNLSNCTSIADRPENNKEIESSNEFINLICNKNELNNKEISATDYEKIAIDLYDIIYDTTLNISKERKLDMLLLVMYSQNNSTKYYRSIIRNEIKNANKQIISNPVFLIPIANCYYCDFSTLDVIDLNNISLNNISTEQIILLKKLIEILKINSQNSEFSKTGIYNRNINFFVVRHLLSKYELSCFDTDEVKTN